MAKTIDYRPKITDPDGKLRDRTKILKRETGLTKEALAKKIFEAGLTVMESVTKE